MNTSLEYWMKQSIDLAYKVRGRTHPNPAVGAVVVHDGELIASGFTNEAGGPHAEVMALAAFEQKGIKPNESTTIFVTLEPCSTHGRTPPCTDAILRSGIKKVVIGATDPNPKHAGKGLDLLRGAGIEVVDGVLAIECEDINLIFNHQIVNQLPFITAKIATTIDGKIATRGGLSKWITSAKARQNVMQWRRYFPAIGVGAGTVLADNPSLTSRIEREEEWCPIRFVFDRNLITFKNNIPKLYTDKFSNQTIVLVTRANAKGIDELKAKYSIDFWVLEEEGNDSGLTDFRKRCYASGIYGVYLEGGANLLSSFLKHQYLDYLFAYRAPVILADQEALNPFFGQEPKSMAEGFRLKNVKHQILDEDQLIRGYFQY